MPFPVIKLFGLFLKQLSKPAAVYLKRKAKDSYWIKTYFCIPPAQLYHRMDVKLKMWSSGHSRSKDLRVTPLSETAAIDMGADMLSEGFVFFVGASIIGIEYWRQSANAAKKEHKQDDNLVILRKDINLLNTVVRTQRAHIDKLTHMISTLDTKDMKLVSVDPVTDRKTGKSR